MVAGLAIFQKFGVILPATFGVQAIHLGKGLAFHLKSLHPEPKVPKPKSRSPRFHGPMLRIQVPNNQVFWDLGSNNCTGKYMIMGCLGPTTPKTWTS